ncbi:MAG: twin-arginine translocation signal domain-containing protein [Planctomycetes bacterium]|nr:twin-arginine translocation signal domain-containing protein [Planctomycetia bacterium]MBI3464008.1 twin-arginine translocation signal domain-containing protein [Planctomycetota bacterium]
MPKRRDFLKTLAGAALAGTCLPLAPVVFPNAAFAWTDAAPGDAETLYNGIVLSKPWPPERTTLPRDPVEPAYLAQPPNVIPIDLGRQLFVDDFLIAQTTLKRTYHQAKYFDQNPVLKPDRPWEMTEPNPTAMVFSDGVWFDPRDKLFKMWYMAGYVAGTGYATSKDGIRWEKPELDVIAGTNLVQKGRRDSGTVWIDDRADDPNQRYKMVLWTGGALDLFTSADGIHWNKAQRTGETGDRTTMFYNPFRKRWIYSLRAGIEGDPRVRRYWEAEDFVAGANWKELGDAALWTSADNLDPQRTDLKTRPQLYNLDCAAYESILLGLFTIWRGQPSDRAKPNEVCLGFSRDGFHWSRPDRRPFIPVSERHGDWNWGNVQSAGGGCLVLGDTLYFYCSGRAGIRGSSSSGVCSTGLATLRRDGFASMDAADSEGKLTTRPVRFSGKHLFVNADADEGELRVEALGGDGTVIAPLSRDQCRPIRTDSTLQEVQWSGAKDLAPLAGKPVAFRFALRRGSLFSFWISPDSKGASGGYVAAGGPAFSGPTDSVGRAASRPER